MADFLRHLEIRHETIADHGVYPFSIPALRTLEKLVFHKSVTFLVGENGAGKSTLIEAIAIKAGFNPEGGTRSFTSSARPSESSLHHHVRLARGTKREAGGFFLRAETMFNVATEAEVNGYNSWERVHEMSHGEGFLYVMQERFRSRGLFILDEPESALSPQRQLAALALIHRLVGAGSQFVIATHSPILMAYPDAQILLLDPEVGVRRVAYEETEHFQVTRAFLQNPKRMLDQLLSTGDEDIAPAPGVAGIDDNGAEDESHLNDGTW